MALTLWLFYNLIIIMLIICFSNTVTGLNKPHIPHHEIYLVCPPPNDPHHIKQHRLYGTNKVIHEQSLWLSFPGPILT